jgi:hypothetical protein
MRKWVAALATIAIHATPAYSQGRGKGAKRSGGSNQQTEEQKKKNAEAESAYKAALDKIPDKKYDPWGNVR